MEVNILELKNICFELIVHRYMSVSEGYIKGVEIKGHVCEKKLVKLVIICQKSINCIFFIFYYVVKENMHW